MLMVFIWKAVGKVDGLHWGNMSEFSEKKRRGFCTFECCAIRVNRE